MRRTATSAHRLDAVDACYAAALVLLLVVTGVAYALVAAAA